MKNWLKNPDKLLMICNLKTNRTLENIILAVLPITKTKLMKIKNHTHR